MRNIARIPLFIMNYWNATRTAERLGRISGIRAVSSVLLARLRYNLGPEFHSIFELWNKPVLSWPDFVGSHEVNEAHKAFSLPEDRFLTKDKLAFAGHCVRYGLPTVPTLLVMDRKPGPGQSEFANGLALNVWQTQLASAPERIFIKQIDGGHGLGAFSATREGDEWRYRGQRGDAAALHAYCLDQMLGRRGWLVQTEIRPHPAIAKQLSPRALCTARLVTFMTAQGPRLLFSVLRIPVGDNETDNWSLGMTGNLVAPIDPDTGALGTGRSSRSSRWPELYGTRTHPDTGLAIEGFVLPHWAEAKQLALDAQGTLPQVPTTGWDIAITDQGPLIVETNWGYGVELIQVALQRGIRADLAPTFACPRIGEGAPAHSWAASPDKACP